MKKFNVKIYKNGESLEVREFKAYNVPELTKMISSYICTLGKIFFGCEFSYKIFAM